MRWQAFRSNMRRAAVSPLLSFVVLVSAAFASFCSPASRLMADEPAGRFDPAKVDEAIEKRIEKIFARDAVDKAMDAFVDAILAEPALQKRGERLLQALAADAKIGEASEAVLTKIGESPAMQDLVKELMQQNPGKSPEEIGTLAGARVEKAFDAPAIKKALDSSSQSLIEKLDVNWQKSGIVADVEERIDKCFSNRLQHD